MYVERDVKKHTDTDSGYLNNCLESFVQSLVDSLPRVTSKKSCYIHLVMYFINSFIPILSIPDIFCSFSLFVFPTRFVLFFFIIFIPHVTPNLSLVFPILMHLIESSFHLEDFGSGPVWCEIKGMSEDESRWKSMLVSLLLEDDSKCFESVKTRDLAQCGERLKGIAGETSR